MKVLNNYNYDIENDIFKLRSRNYSENKVKITKEPLLKLKSIYILEENEIFPKFNETNFLLITLLFHKKKFLFVYEGVYDIKNKIIQNFLNGTISRERRIKIIPYAKNYKSILFRNNKPILLGKKIKINFDKKDDYFEIKIELNGNFFIRKIIERITKNKEISIYLGLTVETYKEDYTNEELVCIFGLNNLDLF